MFVCFRPRGPPSLVETSIRRRGQVRCEPSPCRPSLHILSTHRIALRFAASRRATPSVHPSPSPAVARGGQSKTKDVCLSVLSRFCWFPLAYIILWLSGQGHSWGFLLANEGIPSHPIPSSSFLVYRARCRSWDPDIFYRQCRSCSPCGCRRRVVRRRIRASPPGVGVSAHLAGRHPRALIMPALILASSAEPPITPFSSQN